MAIIQQRVKDASIRMKKVLDGAKYRVGVLELRMARKTLATTNLHLLRCS